MANFDGGTAYVGAQHYKFDSSEGFNKALERFSAEIEFSGTGKKGDDSWSPARVDEHAQFIQNGGSIALSQEQQNMLNEVRIAAHKTVAERKMRNFQVGNLDNDGVHAWKLDVLNHIRSIGDINKPTADTQRLLNHMESIILDAAPAVLKTEMEKLDQWTPNTDRYDKNNFDGMVKDLRYIQSDILTAAENAGRDPADMRRVVQQKIQEKYFDAAAIQMERFKDGPEKDEARKSITSVLESNGLTNVKDGLDGAIKKIRIQQQGPGSSYPQGGVSRTTVRAVI